MSTIAGKRPFASGRWTSPARSTPSLVGMLTSLMVVGSGAAAVATAPAPSAAVASSAPARVMRRFFTRGPPQTANVRLVHVYDAPPTSPAACPHRPRPSTAEVHGPLRRGSGAEA